MPTKIRKQFYLEQRQDRLVKRLAEARGVSEAEIIRGLIDAQANNAVGSYLLPDPAAWDAILQFVRDRAKSKAAGPVYQWNRQELYEEREARLERRLNEVEADPVQPARRSRPIKSK